MLIVASGSTSTDLLFNIETKLKIKMSLVFNIAVLMQRALQYQ